MPKSAAKNAKKKATTVKKSKTTSCSREQLLGIIAQLAPLHGGKVPLDLVAKRGGYGSADNGSFKKALSRAASSGLVAISDKEVIELTAKGKENAGEAPPIESNDDCHAKIKAELSGKKLEFFELLEDGKRYLRSEIALKMGYDTDAKSQGAFKKLSSRLRDDSYLEVIGKDYIQLSDVCFPHGRDEE